MFNCPRDFKKDEFKEFMYDQSEELPQMLSWMKAWKNETTLSVFALSNESLELNDYRIEKFGLHDLFAGFFSSCYLGFRKPDPRIFQTALKITRVKPSQSLYFDDRLMFVNIAKKLGMNGVLHEKFEDTKRLLESYI